MMLKTVYGPPPPDREQIEAVETEEECCIRETGTEKEQLVFSGNRLLQEKNRMAVEAGCLSGKG